MHSMDSKSPGVPLPLSTVMSVINMIGQLMIRLQAAKLFFPLKSLLFFFFFLKFRPVVMQLPDLYNKNLCVNMSERGGFTGAIIS